MPGTRAQPGHVLRHRASVQRKSALLSPDLRQDEEHVPKHGSADIHAIRGAQHASNLAANPSPDGGTDHENTNFGPDRSPNRRTLRRTNVGSPDNGPVSFPVRPTNRVPNCGRLPPGCVFVRLLGLRAPLRGHFVGALRLGQRAQRVPERVHDHYN